jgi:hypothetical protein
VYNVKCERSVRPCSVNIVCGGGGGGKSVNTVGGGGGGGAKRVNTMCGGGSVNSVWWRQQW